MFQRKASIESTIASTLLAIESNARRLVDASDWSTYAMNPALNKGFWIVRTLEGTSRPHPFARKQQKLLLSIVNAAQAALVCVNTNRRDAAWFATDRMLRFADKFQRQTEGKK